MTTITVRAPAHIATPLGSKLAAAAFGQVLAWLRVVAGSRAERPEASGRATEANRVRNFANKMLGQDPRFAAALYAAADRHERC